MDIQIHKAQKKKKKKKTPDSLNLNTATLRPFKIKSSEVKDNFKSGPHKGVPIRLWDTGVPIRLWADFSTETFQTKRE